MIVAEDIIHEGLETIFRVVKLDGVLVVREESCASVHAAEVLGRSVTAMREGNDRSRMELGQGMVDSSMMELLYLFGSALVGNLGLEDEDLIIIVSLHVVVLISDIIINFDHLGNVEELLHRIFVGEDSVANNKLDEV